MANAPLQKRLSNFKQKFQAVLGGRSSQYEELSTLEQPLVGNESASAHGGGGDYQGRHGVPAPGGQSGVGSGYRPAAGGAIGQTNQPIPNQSDELQLLAGLAQDAAGILWELAAMHETGDTATEMVSKSKQLQAQLRGMIADFMESSADEGTLAAALQAFEALTNSLEEYEKQLKGEASGAQQQQAAPAQQYKTNSGIPSLQPPPGQSANPFQPQPQTAPQGQRVDDEKPLIDL
jgi:hypothetical protein